MVRKLIAAAFLCALTACSPQAFNECPREGGIGGTGDCTFEEDDPASPQGV